MDKMEDAFFPEDDNDPNYLPPQALLDNWKQFFPLDSFRQYQEKTIEQILKGWQSGKKYAILEGPTGSGKSVVGITLGRVFGNSWVTTPQKMLQDQYIRDFHEYLIELKGRSNYPCLRINFEPWVLADAKGKRRYGRSSIPYSPRENVEYVTEETYKELDPDNLIKRYNCSNAPCCTRSSKIGAAMRKECKDNGICPYIKQRDMAMDAPFTLLNFSNLLLFTMLMPKPYKKRPLLIIDECHLLESFLYEFASISLTERSLAPLTLFLEDGQLDRITQPFSSITELCTFIKDVLMPAFAKYFKSKQIIELEDTAQPPDEYKGNTENERDRMAKLSDNLMWFVNKDPEPTDHSHVIIYEEHVENSGAKRCVGVKIKPFSVAGLNSLAFGSSYSRVLLMSATILDPKTFCKSLGIDPKDAFFIQVPSTFPPERRPMFCDLTVGSMGFKYLDTTLPKMCEKIIELAYKHDSHKGIIHTGTYAITNKMQRLIRQMDRSVYDRMLFTREITFADKARIIGEHEASKYPTILCGPSFIEGIDLKDALARFNIIMKLPYLSLADPLIKRKSEEFPEWYDLQVALAIVQAAGRAMRSKDDWSIIYLLDKVFRWFYDKNIKLFPKHIRAAIRWVTEYGIKQEQI